MKYNLTDTQIRCYSLAIRDRMLRDNKFPKLEKFYYYDLIIDCLVMDDVEAIAKKWQRQKGVNENLIAIIINVCHIFMKEKTNGI